MKSRLVPINELNYEFYLPMLPEGFIEILSEDEKTLVFGIETIGAAAGCVIIKKTGFVAEITWFYISEPFRGTGTGSESFLWLVDLLHRSYGVDKVYMDIPAGADEGLYHIFNGFDVEKTPLPQCTFLTTLGALMTSDKLKGASKHSVSLGSVDRKKLMIFCNDIINHGADYIDMPIEPDDFMKDQSAVFMEDDEPKAILLFTKKGEELEITFMVSLTKNPSAVLDMLLFAVEHFRRFGEDTPVTIHIVEPKVKALIKRLLSMEDDDEYGFTYSQRITMDLNFLDETAEGTNNMIDIWKSLLTLQAS